MIASQTVFEKVKTLLDIPEENTEALSSVCADVSAMLSQHLKAGSNGTEADAVYLAAALSIYRYALLRGCSDEGLESIKTGDVTVKRSNAATFEYAEKLVANALLGAHSFADTSFVFRGM